MRFSVATILTLLLGVLLSAGLYALEYIHVPASYGETLLWLGPFHMVILHMPIGLLAAWVLLQLMQWFMPQHDVDLAISTMLLFTWLSAVLAVSTGTFLDWYGKYSPDLLDHHRQAALLFTAFLTMALTFRILRKIEESALWVLGYIVCFLGASLVMLPTGHRGGTLTHGAGFLTNRAPDYVQSFLDRGEEKLPVEVAQAEIPYFSETILPLFEEYCTRCHGAEKQKGDLRLDSYAAMMQGSENGPIIHPDTSEEGSLWIGLTLELEDDLHMPPDGKPQLLPEELETLKTWILDGAKEKSTL